MRPSHSRTYARQRGAGDGTIRRELTTLRSALRLAEREAMIPKAPAVVLPPAPEPADRWLTRPEAARLLWSMRGTFHLRFLCRIVLRMGARPGHVLTLRWADVDLVNGTARFRGSGNKRGAVVPIPARLRPAFRLAQAGARSAYVIEWNGQRVESIKTSFRRARARAGLGAEVVPKTLRHTAATWWAQNGVALDEIARILGHSDPAITHKVYAKWQPDQLRRIIDR